MRRFVMAVLLSGCTGEITTRSAPSTVPDTGVDEGIPALAAPLSRMTSPQYNNTVKDLFAPIAVPDQTTPGDVAVESFDNNTGVQTPSSALIEAYHANAQSVATAAMLEPAALLRCMPTDRPTEDSCAAKFLGTFVPKAFRRPVSPAELKELQDFYTEVRVDGTDFTTAMTLTIEAVLESPTFLYRIEVGSPVSGRADIVALTAYEVASRLSYFLWNTMPDRALLDAAAAGDLATRAGVKAQAERLLADPRARESVANFHRQWLKFEKMKGLTKDRVAYPNFSERTVSAMRASAEKYVEDIFFNGGSFKTLLTDDRAWVNDELAEVYGVPSPGPNLTLVKVDPTQRSGILTNAGLLAAFAHQTTDAPVLRGVFVLGNVMCEGTSAPPAGVSTSPPAADTGAPRTTRDRFALQHEQGACAGCHNTIDGIGFGFEHYDAIGQWRASEAGLPIDSKGWFTGGNDPVLTGTFDGALELGQKLAASSTAQSCIAANWLRYALGVDHTGIDKKALAPIISHFSSADLDLHSLVIAITTSDAFNTRVVRGNRT